jgi:hypothetical protein
VYPQHLDLAISKHLRIRDFITHDEQADVWPKYIALQPRLLDKLELVVTEVARMRGVSPDSALGLDVHSGFRTPAHNAGVQRAARDSRHQYGDAADVAIDADGDGVTGGAFGDRPAALTRNSFRLPSVTTLDISAAKQFTLAGSNRIEIRADVFNATSNKAVTSVNNTIGLDVNNPPAMFGQPTNRQGAIEGQLSIRYRF